MQWPEHGSYRCSDSLLSRRVLCLTSSAADPEAPIQVSFWPPPTPSLRKEMVPQRILLAPVLFPLAQYPYSTEKHGHSNGAQEHEIHDPRQGTSGPLLASTV